MIDGQLRIFLTDGSTLEVTLTAAALIALEAHEGIQLDGETPLGFRRLAYLGWWQARRDGQGVPAGFDTFWPTVGSFDFTGGDNDPLPEASR